LHDITSKFNLILNSFNAQERNIFGSTTARESKFSKLKYEMSKCQTKHNELNAFYIFQKLHHVGYGTFDVTIVVALTNEHI